VSRIGRQILIFIYQKAPFSGLFDSIFGIDFFFSTSNPDNKSVCRPQAQMVIRLFLFRNQHISSFPEPFGEERNLLLDDQIF
jgi:hypothetical protein